MDIIKYLSSVDVQTDNEDHLRRFLEQKEEEIKNTILKMYEEYALINSERKDAVAIDNLIVEKEVPIETTTSEDINSITEVDNSKDEIVSKEIKNLTFESKNEVINSNMEKAINITGEIKEKQPEKPIDSNIYDAFSLQIKNKVIILPNGKANQDYKFLFNVAELGLNDIGEYWFEGIDQIGLIFNSETKEISGKPTIAGDHKIKIKIKRNDWSDGKPIFEREITLIINPDPKTLWKNIPTPSDIEYFKPDCDKCFVKVEAGTGILGISKNAKKDMVAASQRGRSHAQEAKPRDDDFALKYIKENDWYILTVADGAGSAKSSRKGSEIACKTVIEVCENQIRNHHKEFENNIKDFSTNKIEEKKKKLGDSLYNILGNAVFKSLQNIKEEAKVSNKPVKDFSTTLIVSICKKFKFGWFVGAFWVGDGGIGIYNKETQFLKVLGESDGGEFAGQTRFLTMPEITEPKELYRRLRFDIVDDFTALVLMTDGITDPKFETDANLLKVEKWNELWQDLSKEVDFSDNNKASADQLLGWLDFWSQGNHDDRTIAILF